MKTLEACYELDFSKVEFMERKQRITHPKTVIFGPPKSGKSYLIYDYLSHFNNEEYLYIDLLDSRNNLKEIKLNLSEFIKEYSINVLVLENFSGEFELPVCDSIIITTTQFSAPYGFKILELMPLDFEEFLLHEHKHQNTTHSFNYFLKYGNLPELLNFEEHKKIQRVQEIIKLICHTVLEEKILHLLFESVDEKKSVNQLYTTLKKEHKISKDKLYEICKIFEHKRMIFFISKYNQSKAIKKIYSYNHAFLTAVSHQKKFKNEFANLVFLELHNRYKEIFYLDNIDFYLPKEKTILLVLPFFNNLLINNIKKRVSNAHQEYDIKKVFIITVGNSENLLLDNLEIQVLPFYEWALLN